MKKLLFIFILVLVLTGCGKKETESADKTVKDVKVEEDKKSVEEDVSSEEEIPEAPATEDSQDIADTTVVQEPSNDTTTEPNTRNTGATTKPSTGSTGSTNNSGSTGSAQNNNTGTTTQPSTPVHEHKWTEVTEEEIHYYAWRTICNVCKMDMTDMTDDELTWHVVAVCGGSYANYFKEVNFVTENIQKETIITGYKCECGAEKK